MIEGSKRSQGRTKIASCPIASKDSESLGINVDPAKTQTKWKQMIHMDDINLLGLRLAGKHRSTCKIMKFMLHIVNVTVGAKEDRMMMTGMHTVVDTFCVGCGSIVGWKYEAAHDKTQKYKEGKFILERFKVAGPDGSLYTVSHDDQLGSDADEP
ncbi:Protein yippee-like [Capsicum chinense]|nr:Protein yippee-like [Capsicum chinense]